MGEPRKEVRWFARKMEHELRANDGKDGWDSCGDAYLLRRIADERAELGRVLRKITRRLRRGDELTRADGLRIVSEAADVANFAMMIADNWRHLAERKP